MHIFQHFISFLLFWHYNDGYLNTIPNRITLVLVFARPWMQYQIFRNESGIHRAFLHVQNERQSGGDPDQTAFRARLRYPEMANAMEQDAEGGWLLFQLIWRWDGKSSSSCAKENYIAQVRDIFLVKSTLDLYIGTVHFIVFAIFYHVNHGK